jgi:hypothetical protein
MPKTVEYKETNPTTAFEPSDWPLSYIAWIAAGVLVMLSVTPFILILGFPRSLPDADRSLRAHPPAPVLQTNPAQDLTRFRAAENERLNEYRWIDRSKGVVHIPIDDAMRKLVASGYPDFPKVSP